MSSRYPGGNEAGRPIGNRSAFGQWPPRHCLGLSSGLCALDWEEGVHPQRGLVGLDVSPQWQVGELCHEGLPLLLALPTFPSRIIPMGLVVTCGSIQFIQHLQSVCPKNPGVI